MSVRDDEDPFRAHDSTPAWRRMLEGVLEAMHELPAFIDRDPITTRVEDALAYVVTFEDEAEVDAERLDGLERLASKLDQVRTLVGRAAQQALAAQRMSRRLESVARDVRGTRQAILEILARTRPRVTSRPARRPVFSASQGMARRHELRRPFLTPVYDPDPDPFAEQDDDPALAWRAFPGPSGSADAVVAPPPAPTSRPDVRKIARDCLEDVGLLGGLRQVGDDDQWYADIADTEVRLLRSYDALVSLGDVFLEAAPPRAKGLAPALLDVLREAQAYGRDGFAGDPVRAFASSFVLGSVHGDDALYAAIFAIRRAHPFTMDAHQGALHLAASPSVGRAVRPLLSEGDVRLVCLALDVLRLRREADFGAAAPLLDHAKPVVRVAAARCLGVVPERPAAKDALERAMFAENDPVVSAAMFESALRLRSLAVLGLLREKLAAVPRADGPEVTPLFRLLAVAGDPSDAPMLSKLAAFEPERVEWLGFLGASVALGPIAEIYAAGSNHRMGRAARDAFTRIAGRWEREPRAGADVDAVPDPTALLALSRELGRGFDPMVKLRGGVPYTASVVLDELRRDATLGKHRWALALELAIATGGASLFEPSDWAVRQEQHVEGLRGFLADEAKIRAGQYFSAGMAQPLSARR